MPVGRRKPKFVLQCLLCCAAVFPVAGAAESADPPRSPSVSPTVVSVPARQAEGSLCLKKSRLQESRDIVYPERLEQGYTVVLPGVFGATPYNAKLVRLLKDASTAVEYYDWTRGIPLFRRRGLDQNPRNLASARDIAARIMDYQDHYPGRPVHVIGLCAGAGPACEAVAMLPEDRAIDSTILLGPALSPDYDLRPTLRRTRGGIDSFHSPLDIPVLMALTTVVGTMDGQHMPAAGAIGFLESRRNLPRLRQHMYNPKMLIQGHLGGHFGWTASKFVDQNIIPILQRSRSTVPRPVQSGCGAAEGTIMQTSGRQTSTRRRPAGR